MTATLVLHHCASGRRCAVVESTPDGYPIGAAIEAPHGLCPACDRRAERAIYGLPRLYVDLELIMGEHSPGGEHVSGTRENPIPPRVDVLTMQTQLDTTAAMWAAPVARRCRIPWNQVSVGRLRAGPRLARAARILAHNLDALLALPYMEFRVRTPFGPITTRRSGLDGALDLVTLHSHARRLVTGGSGHARLPVPCPHCEGMLIRYNGSDQVDCEGCGGRWPESDYRRLCLVLADDLA